MSDPSGSTNPSASPGLSRADRIADAALVLLAARGMRGLTHRAVDETAHLPQGSTSNHARTRLALLEAAVRRLAVREGQVLAVDELPDPTGGLPGLVDGMALALHRYLTLNPQLLVCRYELALEATRRPELRTFFDETGRQFREPLTALLRAAGSRDPHRHTLSLVAWTEGIMFSCVAGSFHTALPSLAELRQGYRELLNGLLGGTPS
ncbi:TetR/AcrR family transcriptional regulator [Streptomyces sp. VRA16 Mangrove soil]|uniref:TetR/AcrR family transcriptional regulator n=1 Tax=Streptomyces sp. VRA16 Mangrove soil TaxID=2817434 RepID=UPI001A9D9A8E|nr:TetR/AcrR family transcriptional regulator [Streptomyces sp. VRA16 Mangrove soil]MBO1337283.1 TetR/AcrR family transcriptional regulator [Streptomyces sp. VRA16 Mangrove soil]